MAVAHIPGEPEEPQTFDWQAGGGNDTSWRGKSRTWIDDEPGLARALNACKTLAVYLPPEQRPIGFQSTLGSLAADGVQEDASPPLMAATPPAVADVAPTLRANGGRDHSGKRGNRTDMQPMVTQPRVFDASSTHGHEGVGTGMPNMSAPGESLALTTRADRYALFGLEPADMPLLERLEADGYLPPVPYDPKPDGPRYAAMGDAVTVNVAEWIGCRLLDALDAEAAA